MSPEDFRALALDLPDAREGAHLGKADFRVGGRIFATLGYPDGGWAMVKLTRDEQDLLVGEHAGLFRPAAGAWGLKGCTLLWLDAAAADVAGRALRMAWQAHRAGPRRSRKARSRP